MIFASKAGDSNAINQWKFNGAGALTEVAFNMSNSDRITGGEEGALPRECHSLTFFCNSGGYLPYIFL
jgi:hypothetical protein